MMHNTAQKTTTFLDTPPLTIREFLTPVAYTESFLAMQQFTNSRDVNTPDELWLLEHIDVLTQGLAGKAEHVLINPANLPIVQSDRGGQVTWHGRGQLVGYLLYDLKRLNWNVRDLVSTTENTLKNFLKDYSINAYTRPDAPGVYVDIDSNQHKIASLGFKIRKSCSYHGFSLNINCNDEGFNCINPCGYAGLKMTKLDQLIHPLPPLDKIKDQLIAAFKQAHLPKKLIKIRL